MPELHQLHEDEFTLKSRATLAPESEGGLMLESRNLLEINVFSAKNLAACRLVDYTTASSFHSRSGIPSSSSSEGGEAKMTTLDCVNCSYSNLGCRRMLLPNPIRTPFFSPPPPPLLYNPDGPQKNQRKQRPARPGILQHLSLDQQHSIAAGVARTAEQPQLSLLLSLPGRPVPSLPSPPAHSWTH